MKKLLLVISCAFLFSANVRAQITLEHTFDSTNSNRVYCTDIGNNDFKYVVFNWYSNSFSLYNMDMTPYLTNIVLPAGDSISQGFVVIYVTKSLFDCDSTNIEYAYEYKNDSRHPFRILRTDGTLIFKEDSATGPYCYGCLGGANDERPILNTSSGTKLFLQKTDATFSWSQLRVYSLCGNLPTNVYDFSDEKSFVKVFPNPADMTLNFEITFPNNTEQFQLMIIDNNGNEQKRENIDFMHNRYFLDVGNFSSGTYLYSLVSKSKSYQSGKFVITK